MNRALILVDVQNDFMPSGALPVSEGDRIVPIVNDLQKKFDLVVATQDWHPRNHGSFASNHPGTKPGEMSTLGGLPQVLWPDHCVQRTKGARFHPQLDVDRLAKVFRKGTDPEIDSYSGFFDNGHRKSTGMGEWLKKAGIEEVIVAGLATDYCVRYTALDARMIGFKTVVVRNACRGVELHPGDTERALIEMKNAGVRVVTAGQVT